MPSTITYPSGSTDGSFILVTATGSPGQTIHTATKAGRQRIRLDAFNNSTSDVLLTIQWAGTASADEIKMLVRAQRGPYVVIPDWILLNGQSILAYAATTSVIGIYADVMEQS